MLSFSGINMRLYKRFFASGRVGNIDKVSIENIPVLLSGNPNTKLTGSFTIRNLTSSSINVSRIATDFIVPFSLNFSAGNIAANGTFNSTMQIIGAKPGFYQIPIRFQSIVNSVYVDVGMGVFNVSISDTGYTYQATETFYSKYPLNPILQRIRYTPFDFFGYYSNFIQNLSTVLLYNSKALRIDIPADAVNPVLTMIATGVSPATLTVYEESYTTGSVSLDNTTPRIYGTPVFTKKWGAFQSFLIITVTTLQPGKAYRIIPQDSGSSSSNLHYVDLSWK